MITFVIKIVPAKRIASFFKCFHEMFNFFEIILNIMDVLVSRTRGYVTTNAKRACRQSAN